MDVFVDQVCIGENMWLKVGGNTPWNNIGGWITEIIITQNDPRNFSGCDTDFIEIFFDNDKKLVIKVKEYMYVERMDSE